MYQFFQDQGSIIAGILALIAGLGAYMGVRQQNIWLMRESSRNLARSTLIATRLLEGVLVQIQDDIRRLQKLLDQPQFFKQNAVVPNDWRRLIRKPSLEIVWNSLGVCGRELINNYLALDAEIDEFIERDIGGVNPMQSSLQIFSNRIAAIQAELESEGKRALSLLAEKDYGRRECGGICHLFRRG